MFSFLCDISHKILHLCMTVLTLPVHSMSSVTVVHVVKQRLLLELRIDSFIKLFIDILVDKSLLFIR